MMASSRRRVAAGLARIIGGGSAPMTEDARQAKLPLFPPSFPPLAETFTATRWSGASLPLTEAQTARGGGGDADDWERSVGRTTGTARSRRHGWRPIERTCFARHAFRALPAEAGPSLATTATGEARGMSGDAMSAARFHAVADEMIGNLQEILEEWGEDNDVSDFDVSHEEGVMTLQMGAHGTYVINKQAPNRQVWMSSPVSGPLRYDYDADRKVWFYARDGHLMHERLQEELTGMGGGTLDLVGLNER